MGTSSTHALGDGSCSRCEGRRKKASSDLGYCKQHEVRCHVHSDYAFLNGDTCGLCKAAAQRAEKEAKEKKAKEQKAKAEPQSKK
ncbi:hypothetical protein Q7P37_010209 [Cladosporium fusiforme]